MILSGRFNGRLYWKDDHKWIIYCKIQELNISECSVESESENFVLQELSRRTRTKILQRLLLLCSID